MKNSIEYYISQLLYKNDCVIVMNFGGFVCSSISANLNKKTGILTPPNKSILFNPQLKDNDGLLINHIAQSEGISQEDSKINLLKFVEQSLKNLNKFKSCRFDEIGLFTLNSDKNIIFTQDLKTNYNLNSFGFQDIINNKITRDNSEIIEESLKLIKKKNNFTTKRLLKAAAIIIPLIGISFLSITQEDRINNIYTQIANVNPISFKKDNVTGYKKKICMIQFIKGSWHYGEMDSSKRLEPEFEMVAIGKGFVGIIDDTSEKTDHEKVAKEAIRISNEKIQSKKYDIVILDEINYAVNLNLISLESVLDLIKSKPENIDLILTGNYLCFTKERFFCTTFQSRS